MTVAVIAVAVLVGLAVAGAGSAVLTRRTERRQHAEVQARREQEQAERRQQEAAVQALRETAQRESEARLAAADREAEARRGAAEREAEARREAAYREADALRQAAAVEVEAVRTAAAADAALTRRTAEVEAAASRRVAEQAGEEQRRRGAELDARTTALRSEAAGVTERAQRQDERAARLADAERALTETRLELDQRRVDLDQRRVELDAQAQALDERQVEHTRELARVAGLSVEAARAELLATVEVTARRDAAQLARAIEDEARAEADQRARAVVVEAVQRVASDQTSETVVSVVHLPNEEMKGRIIGREGRNVRSFESVTGVNVIIDDTPEAVLISCFDPVRREVGRLTLERLIADGRIHPHRIEDAHARSVEEIDALCLRAADDALVEVGITDLDPALRPILGRLRYRTSYGQNVLGHLVESAHLAGIMASELGLEPAVFKRCAFLHDIGKAFTHEVEGTHAIIGAALLRRHGESETVAHAVEAHHNEVPPRTVEAVLTQAADACSAARPGARRESLESYVKRLTRIEEIANARPGVEKVFAMQAGRELRVMVTPADVDDAAAPLLAREIARQIEEELTYPGQIRVTVVRETRSTEIAR